MSAAVTCSKAPNSPLRLISPSSGTFAIHSVSPDFLHTVVHSHCAGAVFCWFSFMFFSDFQRGGQWGLVRREEAAEVSGVWVGTGLAPACSKPAPCTVLAGSENSFSCPVTLSHLGSENGSTFILWKLSWGKPNTESLTFLGIKFKSFGQV